MFNQEQLKRDIAAGCASSVYFLIGNDAYLIKAYADKIAAAVCGDNADLDKISFERDADINAIENEAAQFSFLGTRRCILVPDYDFEGANKEDYNKFKKLIAENDGNVLVFYYEMLQLDLKKSSKVKTVIKTLNENSGFVCEINHKTQAELVAALTNAAQKRGASISSQNARYLIERTSPDLNLLINEIEKLCLYANGEITAEDIDKLCAPSFEASMYDIARNIIYGNVDAVFSAISTLTKQKVSHIAIYTEICAFFTDVYNYKCASVERKYGDSAAAELMYPNNLFFRLNKNGSLGKNIGDKYLDKIMELLLDADAAVKDQNNGLLALEKLIIDIVSVVK